MVNHAIIWMTYGMSYTTYITLLRTDLLIYIFSMRFPLALLPLGLYSLMWKSVKHLINAATVPPQAQITVHRGTLKEY